jgi:signal transduction histidine kinase
VLTVDRGSPVVVRGHRSQVLRAVLNLADNAIKYTPRGGRVTIALRADDTAATIEVRDTGPGIPPSEHARIFERFHRGDPAHGRGGTGLGLAIVRSIVAIHGGRVEIESRPGAGSVFRIVLPR